MITLTNPQLVKSVLGGTDTVGYDKLVLSPITYNPQTLGLSANVRITSTSVPTMQQISGSLEIQGNTLTVEVAQLDFYRKITLTGGQVAAIQTLIRDAQNALEAGLITVGVVAGIQAVGG